METSQEVLDARNNLWKAIQALFDARYAILLGSEKDCQKLNNLEQAVTQAILAVEQDSYDEGYNDGWDNS